jgi:pyruvate/2-oxoglutarate dehydrogenase complex dihydrolipoamide dehydrogenase (E3) component
MQRIETDPSGTIRADICIIGAGSAGLSVAAGAAQMGARTVLIEASRMGGECLNTGCVPSKSLLAVAKRAHAVRTAARFGVRVPAPDVEFSSVQNYVRGVISKIAPHDSVERFTALGCTVIKARARFVDGKTVAAGERRIVARRFVIATGSRPAVPSIPGLADVPYFTNETVFDSSTRPDDLMIIGAGPVGCEMAQAFRRLGSKVTLLDLGPMLPRDDPEAVAVIRRTFLKEGIAISENVRILRIERRGGGIAVALVGSSGERWIEGSHVLFATGRRPNVEELGLHEAGVRYSAKGVTVDARLRTSNRRIFAAGDVVGEHHFTHLAGYHAGIVLRNTLFHLPAKADIRALPWVTYTEPELAQVGLTEAEAEAEARRTLSDPVRLLRADFVDNDRAQAEEATEGFLKVLVSKRGRPLGATIVGPQAGELIQIWVLAIDRGLRIDAMANMISPYPTLGEINKRAATEFYAPTLFNRRIRALVRFLGIFP